MQLESYKGNTKIRLKIRDFKSSRTNNKESKGQTKDFKKRKHLSGLYSNSNNLKMAYA